MKKVFRIMLTTVMMVAFSVAVIAQEKNIQTPTKRQRVSREQMAEMQAKHISRQLALDDATSQKFIETYCAYQKEVWALRPHKKEMRQNRSEMTDADAEKAIKEQFDHSQKVLSLRQEYYKKYNTFLSAKQIQRVYDLEKQAMNRLAKRGSMNQRNKRNGGGRPNVRRPNNPNKDRQKGDRPNRPKLQD